MIGIVRTVSINYRLQSFTLIKEVDLIYMSTSYMCWLMHQLIESHAKETLDHSVAEVFHEAYVEITSYDCDSSCFYHFCQPFQQLQ